MSAVLPGGYVLPMLFTSDGAITVGSPVYRSAAGVIKTCSDTDDATTQAKDVFGVFNGTAKGGDAADGDATCEVAIGPCEVNCGATLTAGDMAWAAFSATSGETVVKTGALTDGDYSLGQCFGDGASGGKIAVDVRPNRITYTDT